MKCLWVLAGWLVCTPLLTQPLPRLAHISDQDGLPSRVVYDMAQDHHGFMWLATSKGLTRYDGYDLVFIPLDPGPQLSVVSSLWVTPDNTLWIGTKNQGLFIRQHGTIHQVPLDQSLTPENQHVTSIAQGSLGHVLIGTKAGLYQVNSQSRQAAKIDFFNQQPIVSISAQHQLSQLIATEDGVYQYHKQTQLFRTVQAETTRKNRVVYIGPNGHQWLGTENGLFQYNDACECFEPFIDSLKNTMIQSLVADAENLWIGTLYDGLYRHSLNTNNLQHYPYNERNIPGQLADTNIMSLLIDRNNSLWMGTFRGGINHFNLTSVYFGLSNYEHELLSCAQSMVTYDLLPQGATLWVATETGLLELNQRQNSCELHQTGQDYVDSIRTLLLDSEGRFWVGASRGLYQFNPTTKAFTKMHTPGIDTSILLMTEQQKGHLLIGGLTGLYRYDINLQTVTKITSSTAEPIDFPFNNHTTNQSGQHIFATNRGVFVLTDQLTLERLIDDQLPHSSSLITAVWADDQGGLWLGAELRQLLYLNKAGHVENRTAEIIDQDIQIQDILSHQDELWISSNLGIFRYDPRSHESTRYDVNDGLQDNVFLFNANHQSSTGQIYFGGKNGFNSFLPDQIPQKSHPPLSLISQLSINGRRLEKGDKTHAGYLLDADINDLDHLLLNHLDNTVEIEFSAADFADSKQNQFAHRLLGFNDDWQLTTANKRHATYTNLAAGDYIFELKSANKYGQWSTDIKQLSLRILPAPWLSVWAYVLYFLTGLSVVWAWVHYKARASHQRAKQLEATIVARTQEVNAQKQKIESLLQYKNEIFANVTHEFKTPLTLITGPLDQLADETVEPTHLAMIDMVQRNAQRLMMLVSQILKLSEAELSKNAVRAPQAVQPILTMLCEAFKPIANSKGITLTLENQAHVNILATPECLELVIGNLLSNAVKFTPVGGQIEVVSNCVDEQVTISIKDTGTGIKPEDLEKIFTRFVRLDAHKSTQGTGIGLSVVEEITQTNGGTVQVNSEWGTGTTFSVTFPVTAIESSQAPSDHWINQMVQSTQTEIQNKPYLLPQMLGKNSISILIIEDNTDMQTHIGHVLRQRFHCLFANNGKAGIALALKRLPDIIICDVMMPGMDGYQVTRVLRNDSRTSHIPIVLLTALNTKASRIKGWRENIDMYIAKPFDATELNAQLDNILIIRKMLQQKANQLVKNNGRLDSINLPEQDLKFIEKLKDVISKNHTNSHFQKADLASKMAVSTRLLHKKVTALIDESPMQMLRDYRLRQAAERLKKGYQVNLVSDECGFNSVPYFCRCFREKYGMSPKKYQLIHRVKNQPQ